MACGNENRESAVDLKESTLCYCAVPIFQLLCVFIGWRRWKWEISHGYDKVLLLHCLMRESRRRKQNLQESHLCGLRCGLSLTFSLSFLIFLSTLMLFAFLHLFSPIPRVIFFLSTVCLLVALPIWGPYSSLVQCKYTLSHLQFHALEPFTPVLDDF